MNVTKCTYTLVIEVPSDTATLSNTVLDQNGFPWGIEFFNGGKVGLKPLRPNPTTEVSQIFNYDERKPVAVATRIYDYIAALEALDWEVQTVFLHPDDNVPLNLANRVKADEGATKGTVNITAGGFVWGPLPLSPMESPAKWPFLGRGMVGQNQSMTLTPSRYEGQYEVSYPPYRLRMGWRDALEFARMVSEMGWDKAVAAKFPHGARLTAGDMPQG